MARRIGLVAVQRDVLALARGGEKGGRVMRLIDADALRRHIYHEAFETDTNEQRWDSGCWIRYKMFERNIDNAPTIDPVKRGKWKKTYLDHEAIGERPCIFYCSVCNQCIAYPVNYCPSCGAYMRGEEE